MMETLISLLVFSSLPQLVVLQHANLEDLVVMPSAQVQVLSENSVIFSGESLQMRCSVPNDLAYVWRYKWFKDSKVLSYFGQELTLWNAKVKDSGKYHCQGLTDTQVGDLQSVESLPVEIVVDGGWSVLQVLPQPSLVGDTLDFLCRVRRNPPVHDMILYKDGVEVMRQNSPAPFSLINVTLEDQGMYSCRASWDVTAQTHSVISSPISVQVLEILTEPVLDIVIDKDLARIKKMKVFCRVQYNARPPAPPISYYFYKDNNRMGTATSENHDVVSRNPGLYSCKATVLKLHLTRWSEPKYHG